MLDLGFVSAILAEKSFEQVIDFASANGFRCVEIMCWPKGKAERRYAGVTHIDVATITAKKAAYFNSYASERGVYISGLGYYPNPLDPDLKQAKFFTDHIRKVIKAAALMKVPVVNTFIGRDYTKNLDDNFFRFKKTWPVLVSYAEDQGVKIGIENCPMLFTNDEWPGGKNMAISPAVWDRMFDIIPSKTLGLNYDPSHMIWQMMDPIQPIYDYRERIHHIHLKDAKLYQNRLDRNGILSTPLTYHSPKLPGLGDVNWNNFFTAVTDIRYRGPLCIEVEDKAFEGSDADIQKAILTARNYLLQFLA
ncbi:MAG: sugar phosphate isomerase/epimerase family protein [Cyclobacteriaceae bacterium]